MNNNNDSSGYLLSVSIREEFIGGSQVLAWWLRANTWANSQFGYGWPMDPQADNFIFPKVFNWGWVFRINAINTDDALTVIHLVFRKKSDRLAFILSCGELGEMTTTDAHFLELDGYE